MVQSTAKVSEEEIIDKDRIVGSAKQIKGAVKQAVGAVGDAKLESEGKDDKIEGLMLSQNPDDLFFREAARPHDHPLRGDGLYPFLEEVSGLSSLQTN
jgi:uncharacterized protein YjbJ (UPF0337 family)